MLGLSCVSLAVLIISSKAFGSPASTSSAVFIPDEIEPNAQDNQVDVQTSVSDTSRGQNAVIVEPKYTVNLCPVKYAEKQRQALQAGDRIKFRKNRRKKSLLLRNNVAGMWKLAEEYRPEYNRLRSENVVHRSKAGRAAGRADMWADVAEILNEYEFDQLEIPDVDDEEIKNMDEEQVSNYRRRKLYHDAKKEISKICRWTLTLFDLEESEKKMNDLQLIHASRPDDVVIKKKLDQAIYKHEHKFNALVYRDPEAAACISIYYYDKMMEHSDLLDKKMEREHRIRNRIIAWQEKAREVTRYLRDSAIN